MDKTYLDYFNFYLKQCLNEIISYFPYSKKAILENYRALLEGNDNKNDLYVKYYMTKANQHLLYIAKKDENLFTQNKVLYLIEGVNFHELWNSSDATSENRTALWKYLQLLVLLGRKCIPNKKDIVGMLERVGGVIEVPESLDATLESKETEEKEESGGFGNLLKGLGDLTKLGKGLGGLGGLVGGGSGDGNEGDGLNLGGIMKMAQSLSESLKDVDLSKLQEQMSSGENENTTNKTLNENGEPNNDETGENNESSDGASGGAGGGGGIENILGGSLFGDLANEMANTFNFEEMEGDMENGNADIGSVLGNFMKGDNPAKFMNLINNFGNKLQKDIKTGKVNQNELLNQTNQMMGNLEQSGVSSADIQKQAEQMFGANSAQANRVKNNTRGQSARERLQKKLAGRQNKQ
jgi:hypothetical protein